MNFIMPKPKNGKKYHSIEDMHRMFDIKVFLIPKPAHFFKSEKTTKRQRRKSKR